MRVQLAWHRGKAEHSLGYYPDELRSQGAENRAMTICNRYLAGVA
jgi:hypothetical protein